MRTVRFVFRFLAISALLATGACGSVKVIDPNAKQPLPSYSGRLSELFDDVIVPAAVGVDLDRKYSARRDKQFQERMAKSDGVVRVRVTTVTGKGSEKGTKYMLGLTVTTKFAGKMPQTQFTVIVPNHGESAGVLRNFDTRLVGKTFIAMVREFIRPDGDTEMHFHIYPDTEDTVSTIRGEETYGRALR